LGEHYKMDINTVLTGLSNAFQAIIKLFFHSKWTIPIILITVLLYFIFRGMKEEKKENLNKT